MHIYISFSLYIRTCNSGIALNKCIKYNSNIFWESFKAKNIYIIKYSLNIYFKNILLFPQFLKIIFLKIWKHASSNCLLLKAKCFSFIFMFESVNQLWMTCTCMLLMKILTFSIQFYSSLSVSSWLNNFNCLIIRLFLFENFLLKILENV